MVGSVLIALQSSRRDGRGVTSAEFLEPLNIRPGEVEGVQVDGGSWAAGLVYFAIIRYSAFAHIDTSADAGAQSEAFFAGVIEAFRVAARFLDQRPPSITTGMRAGGLSLRPVYAEWVGVVPSEKMRKVRLQRSWRPAVPGPDTPVTRSARRSRNACEPS
jgi:hypothetical protein